MGFKHSSSTYNSVTLVWNSYPTASGYQIYRAKSKNGKYKKIKTTKKTSYTRTKLTTNKTCYYKVRAYKKRSGKKNIYTKFTSCVAATPKMSAPSESVTSQNTGVTVRWTPVSGAKGYEVYRATSANGSYSHIKTLSATSWVNTKITTNKSYYYKVRAYRTVNGKKKHSKFSSPQLGMKAQISKVSGVSAVSQSNNVGLKWSAVSGASGYEVYRATGSNNAAGYTNVGNATSTAFNDYNVANGLTYYYKVRAYRTINEVKVYGDFSSVGFSRSAVVSTAVAWLGCKE